jgi:hypothetical protein
MKFYVLKRLVFLIMNRPSTRFNLDRFRKYVLQ